MRVGDRCTEPGRRRGGSAKSKAHLAELVPLRKPAARAIKI